MISFLTVMAVITAAVVATMRRFAQSARRDAELRELADRAMELAALSRVRLSASRSAAAEESADAIGRRHLAEALGRIVVVTRSGEVFSPWTPNTSS